MYSLIQRVLSSLRPSSSVQSAEPFYAAVARRDLDEIKRMLTEDGSLVNRIHHLEDGSGLVISMSPLIFAAFWGHVEVVRVLLDVGADIGAKYFRDCDALHFASSRGHADVVRLLIERGANLNHANDGDSPLIAACLNDHLEVMTYLLDGGADMGAKDEGGCDALTWASQKSHLAMLRLLIRRGAEVK